MHFEVLVHLLRCIRDNNTLVLNYYDGIKDAPLSDLLRQPNINTDNQLMVFSDSSWQDFQTLAEVQEHMLYFIKVGQLDIEHML